MPCRMALMQALVDELAAIAADPAVKVVVIGGAGPAFCAGHDLRELRANPTRAAYQATFELCSRLMTAHRSPAQAGDRPRARRRDRGGLPARGEPAISRWRRRPRASPRPA